MRSSGLAGWHSESIMGSFEEKLKKAREISWANFGRRITFYLPGMFSCNGHRGKYPAISITGPECALECDHCGGALLRSMIPAEEPEGLVEICTRLRERGNLGVLISGGCDEKGRLPWERYLSAIAEVKRKTGLFLSVHCGLLDDGTASGLKKAGVDQTLIDVIGDDETYKRIYHVDFGISAIVSSMEALQRASLPIVPHIVCGLHYGRIKGEKRAVEMISRFHVEQLVIVSYMKIPGTKSHMFVHPTPEEVADIIAEARFMMPKTRTSMGCARQRGNEIMEFLAIDAGVNRMAIPSEETIDRARGYGLEVSFQKTCCSVSRNFSTPVW